MYRRFIITLCSVLFTAMLTGMLDKPQSAWAANVAPISSARNELQFGPDHPLGMALNSTTTGPGYQLAGLQVTKISSAGGIVNLGDAITYTVNITNDGGNAYHNVVVDDPLPLGTTFVSGSVNGYRSVLFEYLDNFDTGTAYNQSDGATDWSAQAWMEIGDDGNSTSGTIYISDTFDRLQLNAANGDSIERAIPGDLTGKTVALTVDYRQVGNWEAADIFSVDVWNGIGWQTIVSRNGNFGDPAAETYNISAYANADTRVRFRSTANSSGENAHVTLVRVTYDDFITTGASINPPPNLILASDNYDLPAGATMLLTYQVRVDNPAPVGQTSVVNTVSVKSDEQTVPRQATVMDILAIANLGDFVWYDMDADGVQDVGEHGISGVTVQLYTAGNVLQAVTTTSAGGAYAFNNVLLGDYYVKFSLPSGYVFTIQDSASATDATDSDIDPSTGNTIVTTLSAGETDNSWDAGMYRFPNGLSKAVAASSEPSTMNPNMAIGEIVTYEVRVTIPPGVFTNAKLVDTMERGLSYMNCVGIAPNALTTSVAGGFASVCANPTVDAAGSTTTVDVGRRVTFDFGTLTNSTAFDQTLVVTYRAVVLDNAQNVSGVNLHNSAQWMWGAASSLVPVSTTLVIAEPHLSIVKTASTAAVSIGSEITITLTIQHEADSEMNAFDVIVTDDLPVELRYVPGSLECTSGAQDADVCGEAGGTITAQWNNFTRSGGNGRVTFRVRVLALPPGGVVNTANVAWTSLPGNVSAPQNANVFSTERGYDPGDLIDVYGSSSVFMLGAPAGGGGGTGRKGTSAAKSLPATGFAPSKVTDLSNTPREVYASTNGVTVEIPSLGIKLPIVGVPLEDGTWNVAWLGRQAGWLEGSAFPSWNGNSVLTGHVYLSNGLPGPFVNLNTLKYSDKIIIHAYGQKYMFEVRENVVTGPGDTSILKHEEKSWLTLITCREYNEKTNAYRKRVVVRAVLVSVAWE